MTLSIPMLPANDDYGNTPGNGPLRPGGQSRSDLPRAEEDRPDTPSHCVKAQQHDLAIVRDLWAGNTRMHERSTTYLPKNPGEEWDDYRVRLQRAVFTNFYRNTIEGLVGYMFRADPKLGEDVPPEIAGTETTAGQWENIDNAGTHGDVFIRQLGTDAMNAGHAAIFVEFPKTGGEQNRKQEATGEVRPYWVPILKDNIVSWRTMVEHGKTVLTQLVLKECMMVEDGLFGEREQERYRVLYRRDGVVGFTLYEIDKNKHVSVVDGGTYPTQDEIPVAEIVTSGRCGLFHSTPPFLDLAYLNLSHYNKSSDLDTFEHKTCCPIYWEAGVDPESGVDDGRPKPPLVLGPNTARRSTNPEFKVGYASPDAGGMQQCATSIENLKTDMAQLGLAALQSSKRVAETATAKELDKSATDSALAVTARGLQDGVERALYFHARYLGLDDGGSIEINREYEDTTLDAPAVMAWVALASQLGVPLRTVLEALQAGNWLPEGADLDQLEADALAQQAATEAEKARQLQMATQNQPGQPGQARAA